MFTAKKGSPVYFIFLISFFLYSTSTYSIPSDIDPTQPGSYKVGSGEYKLPAAVDPDVLDSSETEAWAKVFYPLPTASAHETKNFPLILMVHGNHVTCRSADTKRERGCTYTYSGMCRDDEEVVPSHEGFNYLAEHLASWGYWVVSINTNRGINCNSGEYEDEGLIFARGKLVLKHLALLHQWSTTGGAPTTIGLGESGLIDAFNFKEVGLFGHSRGGEGVRAAYNIYNEEHAKWAAKIPNLKINAIFEIGATDGLSNHLFDAKGTVWNQLLPLCDGDVSDLQGRFPFERMLADRSETGSKQKSVYEVWGANHNYFNSEWQRSDSSSCDLGSPIFDPYEPQSIPQQKIAKASVLAFFKGNLGGKRKVEYNQVLNPLYSSPKVVQEITQVDRDFSPTTDISQTTVIENFDRETGTNSSGNVNQLNKIDMNHKFLNHNQRAGYIEWDNESGESSFTANFANPKEGVNLKNYKTIDFRVSRPRDSLNKEPYTDFDIQLIDSSGNSSKPVSINTYAKLNNADNLYYPLFQTIRIPLQHFNGVKLSKINGVKLSFNKTKSGALYLANIQTQKFADYKIEDFIKSSLVNDQVIRKSKQSLKTTLDKLVPSSKNSLQIIYKTKNKQFIAPVVELKIASQVSFNVMNSMPVLQVGKKRFKMSRFSDVTNLKEMIFTISVGEFKKLDSSDEVRLIDGKIWEFGALGDWVK